MLKRYRSLLLSMLGLLFTGSLAVAQYTPGSPQSERQDEFDGVTDRKQANRSRPQAPQGFVIIEERLVYVLANEPQLHMTAALAKLDQNDKQGAAEELRITADYVEMQGSRGDGESQKLSKKADELRKLANKLQSDQTIEPQKLRKHFAKTNAALAKHYNALAKSFLQNQQYVSAGHDLNAAALSLRQAFVWSDEQPQQDVSSLIENARHVATQLRAEAVAQAMSDEDRAQPAGARQDDRSQPADPRVGTSPAEAQNIAEHAQRVTAEIDTQIDQLASKMKSAESDGEQKR